MMKLTALVLSLIIATSIAKDVGTISMCVPNADDENECKSCYEEREEQEEENGEEAQPEVGAGVQQCIDKCAAAGYRITELDDVTKLNIECTYEGNDGCEEIPYEVIDFSPNEACIDGCSCPNATGYYPKPEENDENKEEEKKEYWLEFWDMDGAVDNNYDFGSKVRIEAGEDGAENVNQVTIELKYTVEEIKDDDENQVVQNEMNCEVPFFISTGKVGGIEAASGSEVPEAPVKPFIESEGDLTFVKVEPASCGEFEAGTVDFCTLHCNKQLKVTTNNETFDMDPFGTDDQCTCQMGKGFQSGGWAPTYTKAQVRFGENHIDMCTSDFNSQVAEVNVANEEHGNAFTISYTLTDEAATQCVASYRIAKGAVLGVKSPSASSGAGNGAAVGGIIVGVIAIVAAIVFVVKRSGAKKSYQGIP
jgi:hypothetical protein